MPETEGAPGQWRTVRVPAVLVERVERYVANNAEGYMSTSSVVAAALREFLQRHGPQPPV